MSADGNSLANRVFRTLMGEDAWAEHIARQEEHGRQTLLYAAMTDTELAAATEQVLHNCSPCKYQPGEPVYDGVLQHAILPELIKRLRVRDE